MQFSMKFQLIRYQANLHDFQNYINFQPFFWVIAISKNVALPFKQIQCSLVPGIVGFLNLGLRPNYHNPEWFLANSVYTKMM